MLCHKKSVLLRSAFCFTFITLFSASAQITYQKEADGILFSMPNNRSMKITVCTESVLRVTYSATTTIPSAISHIVVKGTWDSVMWNSSEADGALTIATSRMKATVSLSSGVISYFDASGASLCNETAAMTLTQKSISGVTCYEGLIQFNSTSDEGIYGFGQFQNGSLNNRGASLEMMQRNTTDCSPVFLSTRGFGVLLNNYSKINVSAPLTLKLEWATNDAIDYYFMYGPEFDPIIAAYREITGPAPLWPKWAYGFWQCKNYYKTQSEITGVVETYRSKNYPIDCIVQDWNYYPSGMNGEHVFESSRYPDPPAMVKKIRDSLNCHFTISVWPSFAAGTNNENYNFMNSRNYLLNINDYLGTTYDAFNDSAAFYYWKFIEEGLVTYADVDAFWPDATEPESQSWSECVTAQGPAPKVLNIYPLLHSKTIYDGFRKATGGSKRTVCLARSYYAGSQRFGTGYWTGDIGTEIVDFATQVPALLNVCATGMPYCCTDVGGFYGTPTSTLLVRWFQWGAFCPIFRVHGTRNENEVWSWGAEAEPILESYLNLRYRLFPYVYSLAWRVTNEGYTIMRTLPFDYRSDVKVRDRVDEFMFGPAFLVAPVRDPSETSRSVYLPNNDWYDFWTGNKTAGNQTITATAPLDIMPLYVRAGSIVPMGPLVKYVGQSPDDTIELRVYTGADGSFTLYEDEGDNYNYENGAYATIPITWNNTTEILTIGPTKGTFPGMLKSRVFRVIWVGPDHGTGIGITSPSDKDIVYTGLGLSLNKKTGEVIEIGIIKTESVKNWAFSSRVQGRRYIVDVKGEKEWKVRITTIAGRVVAQKRISGKSTCVIAKHLAAGVYVANITYGKSVTFRRKIFVIP